MSQYDGANKMIKTFSDFSITSKQSEILILSLFALKLSPDYSQTFSVINTSNDQQLKKEVKIQLLEGLREQIHNGIEEEKKSQDKLSSVISNSRQEAFKENLEIKACDFLQIKQSFQQTPDFMLLTLLNEVEKLERDLVQAKKQRNIVYEELEDAKYDLIDCKQILSKNSELLVQRDNRIRQLQKEVTILCHLGQSTPKEYAQNLNTTRLNTTMIDDVKDKIKDFLKDAYGKIMAKPNIGDQSQNSNRILQGIE